MIDPLLPAAMPLPTRTHTGDAPVGTPSFLSWALGVPGQGGEGDAQFAHDHLLQHGQPQPDVSVGVSVLDASIDIVAADLMTTVVAPTLHSTSTATPPEALPTSKCMTE